MSETSWTLMLDRRQILVESENQVDVKTQHWSDLQPYAQQS